MQELLKRIKLATGRDKDGSWLDDLGSGTERAKHVLSREDIDKAEVADMLNIPLEELNSDVDNMKYDTVNKLEQLDDSLNVYDEVGDNMFKILEYMYNYCQDHIPDDATGRVFKKVILTDPRVAMEVHKALREDN
ncbi:hypothetical protein [Lactobacillus jensenii]|uniref:Uncharacterized protein n=1 Tax=Lactobacillus jensenii TaxID=109790 RepID=A0A5N1IFI0_LACJE|nr:hypothetical protein [Lactobacillus jensenii]KAA9324412.1 hypothetical protein F6H94_00160 [Lactobacillus jensenii]